MVFLHPHFPQWNSQQWLYGVTDGYLRNTSYPEPNWLSGLCNEYCIHWRWMGRENLCFLFQFKYETTHMVYQAGCLVSTWRHCSVEIQESGLWGMTLKVIISLSLSLPLSVSGHHEVTSLYCRLLSRWWSGSENDVLVQKNRAMWLWAESSKSVSLNSVFPLNSFS